MLGISVKNCTRGTGKHGIQNIPEKQMQKQQNSGGEQK